MPANPQLRTLPGFKVELWAKGDMDRPRLMLQTPNGDVLVSESGGEQNARDQAFKFSLAHSAMGASLRSPVLCPRSGRGFFVPLLLGLERKPASKRRPAWQPAPGVSLLVSQVTDDLSPFDHDSK